MLLESQNAAPALTYRIGQIGRGGLDEEAPVQEGMTSHSAYLPRIWGSDSFSDHLKWIIFCPRSQTESFHTSTSSGGWLKSDSSTAYNTGTWKIFGFCKGGTCWASL